MILGQEGWVLEPKGMLLASGFKTQQPKSHWQMDKIQPPVISHIAMETMAHFVRWFTVPLKNGGVPVRNLLQKISKNPRGSDMIFTDIHMMIPIFERWSPMKSACARWAGLWLPWWRLVAADAQRAGELLGPSKHRQFFFWGGGGELPEKLQWDGNIMGYYDIIWEWDQPTILGWFGWMFLEGHQPPFRGTQILIHTKQLESNKLRVCYGIHGHLERWFTFKKMVMCHRYVRRVAKVGHATGDLEGWDTTKSLLTWRFEFIGFCVYMYLTCI